MTQPRRSQRRRASTEASAEQGRRERAVPVRREGAEDVPITFVNDIAIQHTAQEFIITFSQLTPPMTGDPSELERIRFVTARPVLRVGLAPTRVQELIRMLTENFQNYLRTMDEQIARAEAEQEVERGKQDG